jgi:type II secretory pathway pseudopilin PulG
MKSRSVQSGFTLIALLAALVILSLATDGVLFVLSHEAQSQREAELIRVGGEYVRAIRSYYESSPGTVRRYPSRLDELVIDHRFVGIKRHIRALYGDPVNGGAALDPLLRADGTIEGVASRSNSTPVATGLISTPDFALAPAQHYSGWRFVFQPNEEAPR